jgi:hypothetical protein
MIYNVFPTSSRKVKVEIWDWIRVVFYIESASNSGHALSKSIVSILSDQISDLSDQGFQGFIPGKGLKIKVLGHFRTLILIQFSSTIKTPQSRVWIQLDSIESK